LRCFLRLTRGVAAKRTIAQVEISDQTFFRWRLKYGALKEDEAQRLKVLEPENARADRSRGRRVITRSRSTTLAYSSIADMVRVKGERA
jgi:hypothetical protein